MKRTALYLFLIAALLPALSEGIETTVVIRAKAKDAKFIGTSVGGALVVLRNADTGAVMATGLTTGGTGDTKQIMSEPLKRGASLSDDTAAKYEATIDIDEPQLVTVEVHAPYAFRESMIAASTQIWVIPGKNITGDGIVMEIPGFAVDVLSPQPHEAIRFTGGSTLVTIRANIVMM